MTNSSYLNKPIKNFLGEEKESVVINILITIAFILLISLILFFSLFSFCEVQQTSMTPTIQNGQYVILRKTNNYKIDDIVVIAPQNGKNKDNLIKRVVAVSGNYIKFVKTEEKNGVYNIVKVMRKTSENEEYKEIDESSFIKDNLMTNSKFNTTAIILDKDIYINEGEFLAFGDNREGSLDSRYYGAFLQENVIGVCSKIVKKGSILEFLINKMPRTSTKENNNNNN